MAAYLIQAVLENIHKTYVRTGSGTSLCSQDKICQMEIPTMEKVAMILKKQYDQSVYSVIQLSVSQQQLQVVVVNRVNLLKVNPKRMIYFYQSRLLYS